MFTYKKLAVLGLSVLLGVPTISMAGSFTVSLIQGKTPAEAVQIIAEQIDLLTGRVASIENKQQETAQELEQLRAYNEALRTKVDDVFSETAETRATEARKKQCAEIEAQIRGLREKEIAIRTSFDTQINPLEKQLRDLKAGNGSAVVADTETQILLDRLAAGEELGDFTQEERNKVREYQSQQQDALITSLNEIKIKKEQFEEQINSLELEMERAIENLPSTAQIKALQSELDNLLCA